MCPPVLEMTGGGGHMHAASRTHKLVCVAVDFLFVNKVGTASYKGQPCTQHRDQTCIYILVAKNSSVIHIFFI